MQSNSKALLALAFGVCGSTAYAASQSGTPNTRLPMQTPTVQPAIKPTIVQEALSVTPTGKSNGKEIQFNLPLNGNTANCVVTIDYGESAGVNNNGDSNINGSSVLSRIRTYSAPGTYTFSVKAKSGCTGQASKTFTIADAPAGNQGNPGNGNPGPGNSPAPTPAKLTSAVFTPNSIQAYQVAYLKLDGQNLAAGKDCGGTIDWGDGSPKFENFLAQNGAWRTLQKSFTKAGSYNVTVTPKSYAGEPCVSDSPITVAITVTPPPPPPPSVITKLIVTDTGDAKKKLFSMKWDGLGNAKAMCNLKINFGDGQSYQTSFGQVQPGGDVQHTYAAPGSYTASITPIQDDFSACTVGPEAGPKTFSIQ